MSSNKKPPYVLLELPAVTEQINFPLKSTQRIKYTCFDVSKTLIAFGATSGGIYVFNRSPCEFVQLIPSKDGAITRLAISTDEKHIGVANGRGVVTVMEVNQSLSGGHSSTASKEHSGNEVTSMVWSGSNMLFTGDDVGKISVLHLQNFIAKTMFQISSQTIMSLDSRICQLDMRDCMLLISTLTRCYICNTAQEQYRQIGQKLRDGEYGACFVTKEKVDHCTERCTKEHVTEVKKYHIVDDDAGFTVGEKLANTLIYCARPSSRLWEATVDGTVRRTHQFKQCLGRHAMKLVTLESYNNENITENESNECEGQSVNFPKIFHVKSAIFSFKKDALYFLNIDDNEDTVWFDSYKDIVDCKVFHDMLYVWLSNGSLINLKYMKIDKFLLKCYVDEKYVLCAELCAFFSDYLFTNMTPKLHVLSGLKDKLKENLLKPIECLLDKFDQMKISEATQMKSGIYVVDNTYHTQTCLSDDEAPTPNDDNKFTTLTPEAIQAFKDLSVTMSDKLNSSKKKLKEKWEGFEDKMKHFNIEKQNIQEVQMPEIRVRREETEETIPFEVDADIIYKESSPKAIHFNDVDNNVDDKICKSLYQYFRLSLVGKETEQSNLVSIIENYSCDIMLIHQLMLLLEQYCISVGAVEESKYAPPNIFLTYLSLSTKKDDILDYILTNEILYKYFVDSCISVNLKISNMGCDCGFPLPYTRTNEKPMFSELIDEFIEKQWASQTRNQCYDMCKKMPYLWRKILYLQRNEDLLNILRLLLQMLDESLLHKFLPQFTLDTWDRTIQLYVTLHANMCLNCNKNFDHIVVKDTLSWDDLGALLIKSVGGKNAINVMRKHADVIAPGELTMKFYHTCMLVAMYEKFDGTIVNPLTEVLYCSYKYDDSRSEICQLLRNTNGKLNHTALPIIIAAKSNKWGLNLLKAVNSTEHTEDISQNITLSYIIENLIEINKGATDCVLCGLPLQNEFLIKDGGLWVFRCGHIYHGACLDVNKVKLCPFCTPKV